MMYTLSVRYLILIYFLFPVTQKEKSDQILRCTIHTCRSIILSFLCRVKYIVFWIGTF
jgi:hypothetical protein